MSKSDSRILVTGAGGFIGKNLCEELVRRGLPGRAASKQLERFMSPLEAVATGEIDSQTDWNNALTGIDTIIHLAARAHILKEQAESPLAEFRKVNLAATEHLARSAVQKGVRRFVYVSSIGVNGLQTALDEKFNEADVPNPHNAYTLSKWEAEQSLLRIAAEEGLEVVIVRPPLVYGIGAPGNFALMVRALQRGIPLPLASIRNLRSMIYVRNLVDVLIACAQHPSAAGNTFLVSDGDDISTPELLQILGEGLGRPARLFAFPSHVLKLLGRVSGKADQIERLMGSLRIDSGKVRKVIGWIPPYASRQALRMTAEGYTGAQG